jgi:predicted ArsR family transcriptional regulator
MVTIDNRLRVVHFLRKQGEASLSELGLGLGLSHVTLRRHLEDLMREGMVSPPEKRRRSGPGRPEQIYSLAAKAEALLPENYGELARSTLSALEKEHGAEWLRRVLQEAGVTTAATFRLVSDRDQPAFTTQMLAGLEARGYLPAIGTWSGRRCLTFAHCPYLDAARSSPVVCAYDQALLEALLGAPVVLFRRIAERDQQCIFLVGA